MAVGGGLRAVCKTYLFSLLRPNVTGTIDDARARARECVCVCVCVCVCAVRRRPGVACPEFADRWTRNFFSYFDSISPADWLEPFAANAQQAKVRSFHTAIYFWWEVHWGVLEHSCVQRNAIWHRLDRSV